MTQKDSRLGFDPLAWINDTPDNKLTNPVSDEKSTNTINVLSQTADDNSKSLLNTPETVSAKLLDEAEAEQEINMKQILLDTLALLEPQQEALTETFYQRLFAQYPQVKPLFAKTDFSKQGKMLMAAIKLVANNVDNPQALDRALENMGKKHQGYGALPEHYPAVAQTLLGVMAEFAADAWTDEMEKTWMDALHIVAEKMLAAYDTEEKTMATRKPATKKSTSTDNSALLRIKSIVESMTAAIMMVDLDLKIVYLNPAAQKMMKRVEPIMRETFPFFDADNLLGVCIDDFHKNPAHQRHLLSDPRNLPYQSNIQVGPLTMGLNVTPVYNENGQFIGACQEWTEKTEHVKNEIEVARMRSALAASMTATMLCDADLTITYMNDAVIKLLKNREAALQQAFPGFGVDKLIGMSIDDFHKNPSRQRALLKDPAQMPYQTTIQIRDMYFELNAIMLVDKDGNYLGNAVEWMDVTEERRAEEAVNALISAAASGNLEERIDESEYDGFMKTLAGGINNLLDSISRPIKEVNTVAGALSEGDLTAQIEGEYEGAFGELKASLNTSITNLSEMVTEIRISASQIASAAGEISQGNTDLSQRTEEQASSLEETASSMEELTSTVRQNAENSRQANTLAASARSQAESGGKVIDSTITAMSAINEASNKIEDIIAVIDEIAFQTNLLALNAAVEAARAGEQGRGLAVVASEVRSLAQRSAAAAKEIKVLIKDSVEKVDEGSRLVDESGSTLAAIVNSVKKVSDIIAEIAAASSEQSAGIDQVGKAITQLDEVTQQNAALVEQAAAASESMDEQAKSLINQMNFFTIDETKQTTDNAPVGASKPATTLSVKKPQPAKPAQAVKKAPPVQSRVSTSDDEWEEF